MHVVYVLLMLMGQRAAIHSLAMLPEAPTVASAYPGKFVTFVKCQGARQVDEVKSLRQASTRDMGEALLALLQVLYSLRDGNDAQHTQT